MLRGYGRVFDQDTFILVRYVIRHEAQQLIREEIPVKDRFQGFICPLGVTVFQHLVYRALRRGRIRRLIRLGHLAQKIVDIGS